MTKRVSLFGATFLMLLALISGCAPAASQTDSQEEEVQPTQEETEEAAPTLTDTAQPSRTPRPTNPPEPSATRTPRPSETPAPTATRQPSTSVAVTATTRASTPVPATTEPAAPSATAQVAELVPPGESIWVLDMEPSETGSSAACPAPFYADFYGLVQVVTIDNGITWMRAQDGITYTLLWQSPNVYWGTGQSIYPGYTLTISVVFTSPTGLGATFVLIDQNIEGCNHFWRYGGTLR